VLPYAVLRDEALDIARQLMGLKLERGSRVALVAETYPDFLRFFYACQYAEWFRFRCPLDSPGRSQSICGPARRLY